MDPLTLLIVGSIVSTIVGAVVSVNSNMRTNETNVKLANQTNELIRDQNKQEVDLYHEQRSYDSPSEQVNRLMASGMSKAAAFQAVSPVSTSTPSLSSNFATPQLSPLPSDALLAPASAMSSAASQLATNATSAKQMQIQQQLANNDSNRVVNELATGDNTRLLLSKQTELTGQQIANLKQEMGQIDATIAQINQSIAESQSRIRNLDAQTYSQVIDNMFAFDRNQALLDQMYAQIRNLDANTQLTKRQLSELVQSWAARFYGLQLDNRTAAYNLEHMLPEQLKGMQITNEGMRFSYNAAEEDWKQTKGRIYGDEAMSQINAFIGMCGQIFGGTGTELLRMAK